MTTPPQPPYGGPPVPPPGYASNEEKTWALVAHFGGPVGILVGGGMLGWVAPLIAMVAKGNESPTVRAHSVAALNFQITWAIAMLIAIIIGFCTFGILIFIPFLVSLVPIIFGIIAGIKANEGELYQYPLSLSLVK